VALWVNPNIEFFLTEIHQTSDGRVRGRRKSVISCLKA